MDAVLLARIQFAMTVGFHFLFPPLTIGMSWILVWMAAKYKNTESEFWRETLRFWVRLFTLSFAIGVATGITMEFQFGTNWADYSRYVGDIFGAPLAAEGLLSFFLESTFLGVLIFGWNRVKPKTIWFSTLMVAIGSSLSAFWIIVANSWMQTPAGYEIMEGRAVLVDFWAALFNPSTLPRYIHTINAALTTGAFFVLGISAWFLLKKKQVEFAKQSFRMGLIIGTVAVCGQALDGHASAVQVVHTQPEKLAAMEGMFETQKGAGLLVFGWPDQEAEKTHLRMEVPYALSLLTNGDTTSEYKGLKDFPKEEWPPVLATFASFHTMVGLWGIFFAFVLVGVILYRRKTVYDNALYLKAAIVMIPLPFLANEFGWMVAEIGRQPWIVYKMLKTRDAISLTVSAGEILFSIILFGLIYALLFALWMFLLRKEIVKGPKIDEESGKAVVQ